MDPNTTSFEGDVDDSTTGAGRVPPHYIGLWERSILRSGSAPPDTTTRVRWLQTAAWHADLRVPAERPDFAGVHSLAKCSDRQLRYLLTQEAFCGITVVVQDRCHWHRMLDFQFRRTPDYGAMAFAGDRLEERGIASDYYELWNRIPGSGRTSQAYGCFQAGGAPRRLLLTAGQHFILIRSRTIWAASAIRIQESIKTGSATRAELDAFLDFEASYGIITGGTGVISLSTLPWREGQVAFSTTDDPDAPGVRVAGFEPLLDGSPVQRVHAQVFAGIATGQ